MPSLTQTHKQTHTSFRNTLYLIESNTAKKSYHEEKALVTVGWGLADEKNLFFFMHYCISSLS